jgi:thiamine-phosphate pyrophosphorylase
MDGATISGLRERVDSGLPSNRNPIYKQYSFMTIDWKLCFIADATAAGDRDIMSLIRRAVLGGATIIQLRSKTWSTREFLDVAFRVKGFLERRRIPLFINDRVDIALVCGAQGVHLGQSDMPAGEARRILGKRALIGISANTIAEACQAEKEGANYLGVGPVFFTSSKKEIPEVLGIEGFKAIRRKVRIPVLAIGGINAGNARSLIAVGADGIAVISAISQAADPRRAACQLKKAVLEY